MSSRCPLSKFFTPIRRLCFLWENDIFNGPIHFEEVELKSTITVEEFLLYGWDWEDLCSFASGDGDQKPKIIWLGSKTFLEVGHVYDFEDFGYELPLHAVFTTTSGREQMLSLNQKSSRTQVSKGACNVYWRALMSSNSVELEVGSDNGLFPSGPVLSQFLRGNPSLRVLGFSGVHFKEEHCYALVTLQRTDLEVMLSGCSLQPRDARDSFIEWFQHYQIVTKILSCQMERSLLSALISGNNSVKSLCIANQTCEFGKDGSMVFRSDLAEEDMRSLAQALPGNLGIEDLSFTIYRDEGYSPLSLIFNSMSMHPRIKCLSIIQNIRCLYVIDSIIQNEHCNLISAASKSTVMKAILQMLHLNTVVQTITLPDAFSDEAVYKNSILPRLEMNRSCFEVQRQAVKRADPSIRPQLLGRALHMVRYNPNLVFRFLSENVPAFVVTEKQEDTSAVPLHHSPIILSGQKRKA
jgi:hypothetical protein